MNHSERFRAVFNRRKVDRMPVYYFGFWKETADRWLSEGLDDIRRIPGMDPDWEEGMWDCHDLALTKPFGDLPHKVLEDKGDVVVYQNSFGDIVQDSKRGSTIAHTIKHALEPTRESWNNFRRFLDAGDPRRHPAGWEARADSLAGQDRVTGFMGGSLYGWIRGWMGIENISYIMYDDPVLLEEMVSYLADYNMAVFAPVLKRIKFDFVYFFEDCCGKNGPFFSPDIYAKIFDRYYRRLINFYKENGVCLALVDSDGDSEKLIPGWLGSGFDIIFPIEVGTWKASPLALRKKYGSSLNMIGGVDKHVIPQGEAAIRAHLTSLKPAADEGGYIPLPDHRIPPSCSYVDFQTYLQVYREVFG